MTELGEYLSSLGRRRRELGFHDCATHPCDWAVLCGFPDPMAEWRSTYETEEEVDALTREAGGLLRMFERGYGAAGIPRRKGPPLPGDVGVLEVEGEQAGSIFTGERWTFVGARGIGFTSVDESAVLAVWAVGRG